MWKYYYSNVNVFWNNDTIDKPSVKYLESIEWTETNINVNLKELNKIYFYSSNKTMNLIKIVNTVANETYYYYFKRILELVKNNYLLEYELDYWLTYSLEITQTNDRLVLAERHQDYDDYRCLEFDDPLLDGLSLPYTEYLKVFKKIDYQDVDGKRHFKASDSEREIVYNNYQSVVNGCYCLVLSDSDSPNRAYTYIPILSINDNNMFVRTFTPNNIEKTETLGLTPTPNYLQKNIILSSDLISWFKDNQRNNYKFTVKVKWGTNWMGSPHYETFDLTNAFNNYDIEYLTVRITWNVVPGDIDTSDICNMTVEVLYRGSVVQTEGKWDFRYAQGVNCPVDYQTIEFKGEKRGDILDNQQIFNSLTNIMQLAKNEKYSNKVLGVYPIINVFNLSKIWNITNLSGNDYLTLNIDNNGVKIKKFEIINRLRLNKLSFGNLASPGHRMVYKYFKCYYFDNEIDLSKQLTDWGSVYIGDWINFTNSLNIKTDNPLIPIDKQIMSLPGQQPFTLDTYKNYINANINTVNTGYAIQKQNMEMGLLTGGLGLVGAAANKNVLGALNQSLGMVKTIQSFTNYERQIKASYADKDNVMGNKLLFGATKDTLWSSLLNELPNEHYDVTILKQLSFSGIMILNQTLLLNGVFNPQYLPLSGFKNSNLDFVYIKFNTQHINVVLSQLIKQPQDIKNIIINQIVEYRAWDVVPHM